MKSGYIYKLIVASTLFATFTLATQAAKPDTEYKKGAKLILEQSNHDFGEIPRKGGDLVKMFVYTNQGDAPLVITKVTTSCSCLKVKHNKKPLAPGQKDSLKVIYEPHKRETGTFNKVAEIIYNNNKQDRQMIVIQGNAIDKKQ